MKKYPRSEKPRTRADGEKRVPVGNGSVTQTYDDPALIKRIREMLIVEFNPKTVAKKLGIPKSIVASHRAKLMATDETFKEEMNAYSESLQAITLAAFERGIEVAEVEASTAKSALARVAAAKILTAAPGDLARAQNKVEVNLSGAVALEDIHEIVKRGAPQQEDI